MTLKFFPSSFFGECFSFPSKSFAIRAILAAALSEGETIIENVKFCKDVKASILAAKSLGAKIEFEKNKIKVYGYSLKNIKNNEIFVDCCESALVLRILIFLSSVIPVNIFLKLGPGLLKRPYICDITFNGKKIIYADKYKNLIVSREKLQVGRFEIDGSVSSQFLTGLFFALPFLEKDSEIIVKNGIVSKNNIQMTIDLLKVFGIHIEKNSKGFKVFGNQKYKPCRYFVEGDYSLAAFFIILGVFSKIKIGPLNKNSIQGEKIILDILKDCGAKVIWDDDYIVVYSKKKLKPFNVNLKDIPDLAPSLAVLACFCRGKSRLFGAYRLIFKESNRIESIVKLLNSIGGKAKHIKKLDAIEIEGVEKFYGGFVDGFFDHRIVMAAAVCSSFSLNPIIVSNCESVFKSYSSFFKDFISLGGRLNGVNLG